MEFRILGPLQVLGAAGEVELPAGKPRALLALLLVRRGSRVSTDWLVESLWPADAPGSAVKIIQGYVSQLRRAIGAERIATWERGYELVVDLDEVDVDVVEGLRSSAHGQRPAEAAATLRLALDRFRGAPLPELADVTVASADIACLESLRRSIVAERIDADLALGRHRELVGELEALAAEHPLDERLRAQLMLALYRSGRQADALATYHDARRALADELGLEPGVELRELERGILTHAAGLATPAAAVATAASGRGRHQRGVRRFALAGIALLVALAGAWVAASYGDTPGSRSEPLTSNVLVGIDATSNRVVSRVAVGRVPTVVAAGDGAVWVLNGDDHTVSKVDAGSAELEMTVAAGAAPEGIGVGEGVVWVADAANGRLSRLDHRTGNVLGATRLPRYKSEGAFASAGQLGIGATRATVWVANGDYSVTEVDATSGRILRTFSEVDYGPLAVGRGEVWVSGYYELTRIAIDDGGVRRFEVGSGGTTEGVAIVGGDVWVADESNDRLWRLDTRTETLRDSVRVGKGPQGVAAGAGALWVANGADGTVSRVDPKSGTVVASIRVGGYPRGIAVEGGRVWVSVD